ncbi:hypothetical protein BDV97DRAFT_401844 [Delphinella strobiligena]|nr:hypothetical protein BDV97DRAFT_401844 [Delphinella strobiligena]
MGVKKRAARPNKTAVAKRARTRPSLARKAKSKAVKYEHESEPEAEEESGEEDEDSDSERESDSDTAEVDQLETARRATTVHPCMVCYQSKKANEMVNVNELPSSCRMCFQGTCRPCMEIYLDHYFFRAFGASTVMECPLCTSIWTLTNLEHFLGKDRMESHVERMTHRFLESSANFRWCAADKCVSGQFYDDKEIDKPGGEKVCCNLCEGQNCFNCRVVWHEGLTCKEYQDPDLRKHRGKRGGDNDVRKAMRKENTKRCPHCGTAVERTSGCNNVLCTQCGQFFDYNTATKI